MNYEKLLSENLKNVGGLNVDRTHGMNPFHGVQGLSKYQTSYHFPSSSSAANPFVINDDLNLNNNGYGLKYGSDYVYGHSGVETQQSHYGPPIMIHKGGKLKGAALSALTLLAFLFFLNLLQSCLKDQMDTINPTVGGIARALRFVTFSCKHQQVMVMSAGQRNVLLNRNMEELRKTDINLDSFDDSEEFRADTKSEADYDDEEDLRPSDIVDQTSTASPKRTKVRGKRPKARKRLKQKTIESKLNNLALLRDG